MRIEAKISKLENSNIKAIATITFFDENLPIFVISGLKVMDGANGLWVAMPNRKTPDGEYKDIAYPITKEFREQIIKIVLDKYNGTESKEQEEPSFITVDTEQDSLPF